MKVKVQDLANLIEEHFLMSPEQKVAYDLYEKGVTELELLEMFKQLPFTSDTVRIPVTNALRDLYIKEKYGR